jgi:S-adenosyl-L-methionine hydrolase (adenosine-forming)
MRPVALLSDFGLTDHYAGVLHAVLVRDAPGAVRIDLGHGIGPGDIWEASFQLRCAWSHLPADSVVLAVVDPGVGTTRRAVAVAIGDRWLVAPDNGLATAVGLADTAVVFDWCRMNLAQPSRTFHARDLFAPAAARLAAGANVRDLGTEITIATLVPCPLPDPVHAGPGVQGTIVHVDRFGNLVTNCHGVGIAASTTAAWSTGRTARLVGTYGEAAADEVVMLEGSAGYLELAINCGSAAEATGLERGDTIVFSTRSESP